MSKQTLYIPKKINVGFQLREGTYTGKLAYVIYWDDKGKLKKEVSWESWRHKPGDKRNVRVSTGPNPGDWEWQDKILDDEVKPEVFENVPTEGFVLNKGVGGQRESWGWNARNEYIRVYDPRGFEFEISVANLLYIFQECTSTKGKGLEGEFVYSWDGKELVLLPVGTYEYEQSSKFTRLQSKKLTKNDIIEGGTYLDKNKNTLIYIGRFPWYEINYYSNKEGLTDKKRHVFYDIERNQFVRHEGYVKLAKVINNECVNNYAELVEKFLKSKNGSYPVKFRLEPAKVAFEIRRNSYSEPKKNNYFMKGNDNEVLEVCIKADTSWNKEKRETELLGFNIKKYATHTIEDKTIIRNYHKDRYGYSFNRSSEDHKKSYIAYRLTEDQIKDFELFDLVIMNNEGGEHHNEEYNYYIYKQ